MATLDYAITDYGDWQLPPRLRLKALVPTAAAGANAGTSPPVPVVTAGSNDGRGNITFGTGTTPAAGAQAVVTFGDVNAYSGTIFVGLTASNAAAAALQPYVSSVSATGFTISFGSAPAASQANTIYSIAYRVNN